MHRLRIGWSRFTRVALVVSLALLAACEGRPPEAESALARSLTAAGAWTELGPKPIGGGAARFSGRVTALAVDLGKDPTGNTVYAGTAWGGIWKSTSGLSASPTFVPIADGAPMLTTGSLALDASTTPTTLYVGTGEPTGGGDNFYGRGIMKSVDGGQTWSIATSADGGAKPFLGLGFYRIAVDPTNPHVLLAAAADTLVSYGAPTVFPGVYRSSDGGITWTEVLQITDSLSPHGKSATEVIYDPGRSAFYAAIAGAGFYRSLDHGLTWSGLPSPFTGGRTVTTNSLFRGAFAVRGGSLYAAVAGVPITPCSGGTTPCDTGLYQSTDGGSTWTPIQTPTVNPFDQYRTVIAAPPGNNSLVIGGFSAWVASNVNGMNTTWLFAQTPHADQHTLAVMDGSRWYLGDDGGVYRTTDAGNTYVDLNATLGITQFYDVSAAPNQPGAFLGGTQDNGSVATSSPGQAWNELLGGDGYITAINPSNGSQFFTESNNNAGLFRSDDAGGTWSLVVDAFTTGDSFAGPPFQLMPNKPGTIVRGSVAVWRGPATPSSPGAGWTRISQDLDGITSIQVSPANSAVMYAATVNGSLFKTTDGGASPWVDVRPPTSAFLHFGAVAVHPTDSNVAYLGVAQLGGSKVFATTNGGQSWSDITGNLPDVPVRALLVDPLAPADLYLGTDQGVFVATDGGRAGGAEVWQTMGSGLPNTSVVSLKISGGANRVLVAGTHGRGAWTVAPLAASGLGLGAVADAYVRDGTSAGTNFGTATSLVVKNSTTAGNNRITFLRFPLTGVGSTVTSARLRLFGSRPAASAITDTAFAVSNDSWAESTIDWNNRPALGAKQGAGVVIGTAAQYYEWDLTSLVQAQVSAGATDVSVAVAMDTATSASPDTFNAREASANPPQLLVVAASSGNPPTVAQPAAASPNPVPGTATQLSVLGADDQGEGGLTYAWSAAGSPPAPVAFSANGSNAAKNTTATFTRAGAYSLQVVIRDAGGLTATSSVAVTVAQTATAVSVSPATATVAPGGTQQFTATVTDQFGATIGSPALTWAVSGGGTIGSGGLFTAGSSAGGPFTVTATSAGVSGTARVTVASPTTVTLGPVADAYVQDGGSAGTNFGTATTLLVKNTSTSGNNRWAFLRFDISALTSVTAAKLRLFGSHSATTNTMDSAFAVASNSWTETGLTWNNQPARGAKQGSSVTVSQAAQYYEWDVTSFVQAQKQAGINQASLAVTMDALTNNSPDTFNSREASGNRPQLVVTP
jgi:hypothetical protein